MNVPVRETLTMYLAVTRFVVSPGEHIAYLVGTKGRISHLTYANLLFVYSRYLVICLIAGRSRPVIRLHCLSRFALVRKSRHGYVSKATIFWFLKVFYSI